ncbi:hypothetical protein E2C01_080707 [Portunus trituberculatus]|uniref:Uncharacterized protein n=1 Tax=Portunus trituberculatus TaxID=210409 RepID=A0A5B7IW37_PORTR|nr:hypothetical protein [Portunus trituberculatus]
MGRTASLCHSFAAYHSLLIAVLLTCHFGAGLSGVLSLLEHRGAAAPD